jgi:hypothetical protein
LARDAATETATMLYCTFVAFYLARTRGRRWVTVVQYLELSWPALTALIMLTLAVAGPSLLGPEPENEGIRPFAAVAAAYFGVVGTLAWVAAVYRWRWWVRLLLFAGLIVAGGCAAAALASVWAIVVDTPGVR